MEFTAAFSLCSEFRLTASGTAFATKPRGSLSHCYSVFRGHAHDAPPGARRCALGIPRRPIARFDSNFCICVHAFARVRIGAESGYSRSIRGDLACSRGVRTAKRPSAEKLEIFAGFVALRL
jgi:hypothetical protein